jgi:hypothetical protein
LELDSVIETFTDEDRMVARYLLGELGESESAELEDEMLLDDELYQRLHVVEMNLIDGYVRHEMLPEESRRFEENFLDAQENRDKVDRARVFHESLRLLHGEEKAAPSHVHARGWYPHVAQLFQRPLAAAAFVVSAVLFIAALVVVVERLRPPANGNAVAVNSAPIHPANTNPVNGATPDDSAAARAPTPQTQSAPAPSANERPERVEIAGNNAARETQQEYINRQGGGGVERGVGGIVRITLRKKTTHLKLVYELLGDVPARETYGVTIKNRYDEPIWPRNDENKEEVRPVFKGGPKGKRLIIVNVPTGIFKDSGPYLFEFDDPYIPAKNFTIKK